MHLLGSRAHHTNRMNRSLVNINLPKIIAVLAM